jgi:hypothetical protein
MVADSGRWWPMVMMGAPESTDEDGQRISADTSKGFPALNIVIHVCNNSPRSSQIVTFRALHTELTPRLRTGLTLVGYAQSSNFHHHAYTPPQFTHTAIAYTHRNPHESTLSLGLTDEALLLNTIVACYYGTGITCVR